jgi:TonB family protein
MFSVVDRENAPRSRWTLRGSVVVHLALVAMLASYKPTPMFVTPVSLAMGNGDKSYRLVYFAPPGATNQLEVEEKKPLLAKAVKSKSIRDRKPSAIQQQANIGNKVDADNKNARAGSEYGSLFAGPLDGHDVRPAYPIEFPNPPVSRADFPEGFQGDVIVEVTIDKLGNVIEMKLLHGVGRGIDEKVMATLRSWRYKPAMMDGEPVAEKHDVHFHYPG